MLFRNVNGNIYIFHIIGTKEVTAQKQAAWCGMPQAVFPSNRDCTIKGKQLYNVLLDMDSCPSLHWWFANM